MVLLTVAMNGTDQHTTTDVLLGELAPLDGYAAGGHTPPSSPGPSWPWCRTVREADRSRRTHPLRDGGGARRARGSSVPRPAGGDGPKLMTAPPGRRRWPWGRGDPRWGCGGGGSGPGPEHRCDLWQPLGQDVPHHRPGGDGVAPRHCNFVALDPGRALSPSPRSAVPVYLDHFESRCHHAGHYLGYALDVQARH
jgi:hypothetical protein